MDKNQVACLVTLISENPDSYMFHTPNIRQTCLQAKAMDVSQLIWPTMGEKETELGDLSDAIASAKEKFRIEGIVTGAINSIYQASRIQKICHDLDMWCFNPLWQINQLNYMRLLLSKGFKVIITGVFAYPFDASWVGALITEHLIQELEVLQKKYNISPSGEGGELETFVLDGPILKKRLKILKASSSYANYHGQFLIEEMRLVEK